MDDLGVEGVQLRLDDTSSVTAQTIQATAVAALGATAISITALSSPLLAGTVLQFAGAGMDAFVEVTLAATASLGATALTVNALSAAVNALATARDSGLNLAWAARAAKACKYATAQVKLYCCPRYDDSVLVNSWSVNRWATALGKRWLARRRAQACPKGIAEDAEEALDELLGVRRGTLNIEDVGTRTSGWPFISNVTVNIGYDTNKTRVEPQLSELTPTQYAQYVVWNSALWLEF